MKGSDGFVQGYNAQAAVEARLQLIVGQAVTRAANDKEQIEPMMQVIAEQSGQRPEAILTDSGYCSEKNLEPLVNGRRIGTSPRCPYRDGQAEARRISRTVPTRTATQGRDAGGSHETKATDQAGTRGLCDPKNDRGTGVRTDQASSWVSPVSVTRLGKGSGRMGTCMSYPQYSEVASVV
jgi:hypothetical protein